MNDSLQKCSFFKKELLRKADISFKKNFLEMSAGLSSSPVAPNSEHSGSTSQTVGMARPPHKTRIPDLCVHLMSYSKRRSGILISASVLFDVKLCSARFNPLCLTKGAVLIEGSCVTVHVHVHVVCLS